MLTIDTMRLHLPEQYRERARRIARLVAVELAGIPVRDNVTQERLVVPPITISHDASDRRVARRIAAAVHDQLAKVRR